MFTAALQICIKGIDKSMLSSVTVRQALLHFFEPGEIVAVHLAMDYSEALAAHRSFQKSLGNLQAAQAQLQPEEQVSSVGDASRTARSRVPAPRKLPSENRTPSLPMASSQHARWGEQWSSTYLKCSDAGNPWPPFRPQVHSPFSPDLAMSLLGSYHSSRKHTMTDRDEPLHDIESSGSSRNRASSCSSSSGVLLEEHSPQDGLVKVDATARMPDSRLSSVWEEAGRESLPPKLLTRWETQAQSPESTANKRCCGRKSCTDKEAAVSLLTDNIQYFLLFCTLVTMRYLCR